MCPPWPIAKTSLSVDGSYVARHTAIGHPKAISQLRQPNLVTPARMQPYYLRFKMPPKLAPRLKSGKANSYDSTYLGLTRYYAMFDNHVIPPMDMSKILGEALARRARIKKRTMTERRRLYKEALAAGA